MAAWSESLDLLTPDHQLFLGEALLEHAPIVTPPRPIERRGHDLVDDDVVAARRPGRLLPEPLRGRSAVCRESAEAPGELIADGRVVRGREGPTGIVVQRQEQLDEVNDVSSVGSLGARSQGDTVTVGGQPLTVDASRVR